MSIGFRVWSKGLRYGVLGFWGLVLSFCSPPPPPQKKKKKTAGEGFFLQNCGKWGAACFGRAFTLRFRAVGQVGLGLMACALEDSR